MPSFGEKLKKEREKRSITLEQISTSTKIGTRMLQALEDDKFNQLPGGIFNKGFVRAYARCVGLDEEQTIADYLQASGEAQPKPEAPPELHIPEPVAQTPSRGQPWGIFAAILLLIAVVLSIWSYRQREHSSVVPGPAEPVPEKAAAERPSAPATASPQSPATTGNTQSPPATTQPPAASTSTPNASRPPANSSATSTTSPAASTASPVSNSGSSVATTSPASPITKPAASPSAATPAPAAATPAVVNPPPQRALAPGEFVVTVRARENSWVAISADGSSIANEVMEPGSEHVVHARKQVDVRSGNTGAVDFFFNGKKLPRQGDYGQVKTLTFLSSGLVERTEPSSTSQ